MQIFLVTLIGSFAILDSISVGLGEQERYGYAILAGLLVIMLLVGKRTSYPSPSMRRLVELYAAFLAIGLAMVSFQPHIRWVYVVGDFTSLSMPFFVLLLAARSRHQFFDTRLLFRLTVVLIAASIVPMVVPDSWSHHSGRFEEPPLILAVLTCVYLLRPSSAEQFILSLIVFGTVLLLTLVSGARSALLIYFASGGCLYLLGHVSRKIAVFGFVAAMCFCLVLNSGMIADAIPKQWSELRIGRFIEQYQDEGALAGILEDQSMNNRILEAEDALYERWHYHNWLQLFFGSGHGATFEGATAFYGERALADGQVHHIHFGLVLLYYRYGVPGLLVFAWLVVAAVRQLIRLKRLRMTPAEYYPALVFALGTLGYLAELLLFNQLVDPVLSLTIAGFLATRDSTISARRNSSRMPVRYSRRNPMRAYRLTQPRNI